MLDIGPNITSEASPQTDRQPMATDHRRPRRFEAKLLAARGENHFSHTEVHDRRSSRSRDSCAVKPACHGPPMTGGRLP